MAITNPSSPSAYPATHRMAKVVVSLTAGTDVDRHEMEHARIYIFGYSQGFLDNRTNLLKGWDNKWIALNAVPSTPCALHLIPQDMSGREFIRIDTPRRRICFAPPPSLSSLHEGCTYYYSIKLNAVAPYFSLSCFSCSAPE